MNPLPCDLCGQSQSKFVLTTPRLDGPLVRCLSCGLFFVTPLEATAPALPTESAQAAGEMRRLALRARQLALVEPPVEEGEGYWRLLTARERLRDLRRATGREKGRLLEVGCSTGEMLAIAATTFAVSGVEADQESCALARARGFDCFNGTLFDAALADQSFDVAALYHVIEHLPSPAQAVRELHRVLRPGGWLVIETPNIATPWFHLLGARWRQFIPDHRYFYSPQTLRRLCEAGGFEVHELRSVGKAMSLRLFISRVGRYHRPLARVLAQVSRRLRLDERTLYLRLGDVMRLYAVRK